MNLIENYKKKKESFGFLTPFAEKAYIEAAIDELSEIMMDDQLSPNSPSYRKAHQAHAYFINAHNQIEAEMKRQSRQSELRKPQKKYWAKNSESISEYRKQIREYDKNKSLKQQ
ncbi:MAG: hypothetical protein ACRC77_11315 [Bacteroidales bacterium]